MSTTKRNLSIDLIRLIAAFGVVTIHIPFSTKTGHVFNDIFSPLCVPFFYVSSLTFFVSSFGKNPDAGKIIKKAASRLLIPYLVWTFLYSSLLITKHVLTHTASELIWWKALLYGNSAVQLYFVPQLFAMQMVALALFLLLRTDQTVKKLQGLGVLLLTSAYFLYGNINSIFGALNVHHLVIYLSAGLIISRLYKANEKRPAMAYIGIAFIMLSLWLTFFNEDRSIDILKNIPWGGIGLLLAACFYKIESMPRWLKNLIPTSYGVYLSHIVFLESIQFLVPRIFRYNISYDFPSKLILTLIIFSLAAFLTLTLKKWSPTSLLFLGEASHKNCFGDERAKGTPTNAAGEETRARTTEIPV